MSDISTVEVKDCASEVEPSETYQFAFTKEEIEDAVIQRGKELGAEVDVYQSNLEGEIVEKISDGLLQLFC